MRTDAGRAERLAWVPDEIEVEEPVQLSQVRSYRRVQNGRVQQVRQYVNSKHPTPHWGKSSWGKLKVGEYVSIGKRTWKVVQVNVKPLPASKSTKGTTTGTSTGSKGKGVNTSGPKSTASAGSGLNTGSGIAKAANGGKSVASGTKTTTNVLQDVKTGKRYYVHLPPNAAVAVWVS